MISRKKYQDLIKSKSQTYFNAQTYAEHHDWICNNTHAYAHQVGIHEELGMHHVEILQWFNTLSYTKYPRDDSNLR